MAVGCKGKKKTYRDRSVIRYAGKAAGGCDTAVTHALVAQRSGMLTDGKTGAYTCAVP